MNKDLIAMFEYLEREKNINRDVVAEAIEEALITAAKKGGSGMTNICVTVNRKTGDILAMTEKEIVENVEYPAEEISLEEAREIDPDCLEGQWLEIEIDPKSFGRIAANVARQMISQKIRGAEKEVIHEEYRHRIGELISGTVRRVTKGHTLIVDLGKIEAILPGRFYPKDEKYHIEDRILTLLYDVQETENGGAEVVLSRSHPDFVAGLFASEVPEINDGVIEIKKIVRDAGYRTKMAVISNNDKVDPVGGCVGMRGARVKNIIREVGGEKIDILPYSEDPFILLKNALSPCEIKQAEYFEEEGRIMLIVNDEDYPIVLGKHGSNARLTGELVGMKIDFHKKSEYQKRMILERKQLSLLDNALLDEKVTSLEGINKLILDNVLSSGFDTSRKILETTPLDLSTKSDISLDMADNILEEVRKSVIKETQGI
ncbi:MAG: Transcription termination/antitermination protein NusA [Chlamydiia bacterium]|nr:Transcription termination/antitermination protein NusA [Chlamydiia bacterium]MCH9618703.1 Transcription termination/antitermination protein NusA [Chlamydiia bacterium]MCH9624383.1 Transcription termination/antitermination protein NusA [Chlamydiia bacterium]